MAQLAVFKKLCFNLNQHDALHIPSPAQQKRRAAVAAIVRWKTPQVCKTSAVSVRTLDEFFQQDWVCDGEAEILYMKRTSRKGDRWSGHVSFVGGKNEPGETDRETVEREVMEEIGVDLSSSDYIPLGQLDERQVTSLRDNKLLMMLIPFVYLQVVPESPAFELQESEVAAVQWVPLSFFLATELSYPTQYITEPLMPIRSYPLLRPWMNWVMGSVSFAAVDLSPQFRLWGLTLLMTRDLVQFAGKEQDLAFVRLVNQPPVYSRRDIGWLVRLITYLSMYSKEKEEWDKVLQV
ncbi:hypothetical protein INT47_008818 [Mucor saturninus]|uniref:Nudix hydrolase domain-containing protein n=1 Tax=Mucor saturninus TaxID=64648 RepID=A0A8H7RIE1_9FUNG|nr:hypothetical protein INT47_008818 [Mucor saturninus]